MTFTSKKRSLIVLGITAIGFSRLLFSLFKDPEGPNLLVVMGGAMILYFVSLKAFAYGQSVNEQTRFWRAVLTQIVLVVVLYFLGIYF